MGRSGTMEKCSLKTSLSGSIEECRGLDGPRAVLRQCKVGLR